MNTDNPQPLFVYESGTITAALAHGTRVLLRDVPFSLSSG